MKIVVQRVKNASVTIDDKIYSHIDAGMLILFCAEKGDTEDKLDWISNKIISLRFFEDENGKMNKSIRDVNGDIMVVSQFTLAADCKKGTRQSFDNAENPEAAKQLYEKFISILKEEGLNVQTGVFAAMMQVSLINDGPVTFVIEK